MHLPLLGALTPPPPPPPQETLWGHVRIQASPSASMVVVVRNQSHMCACAVFTSHGYYLRVAFISLVPRPLPDFISQPWKSIGSRPSPAFSPQLRHKIWEWLGDEARCLFRSRALDCAATIRGQHLFKEIQQLHCHYSMNTMGIIYPNTCALNGR